MVDPSDWSEYIPALGWDLDISDINVVWNGFLQGCLQAGSTGCRLASHGSTVDELTTYINSFLDQARITYQSPSDWSWNDLVEDIYGFMYSPSFWTQLSECLSSPPPGPCLESKRARPPPIPFLGPLKSPSPRDSYEAGDYTLIAIACSDTIDTPPEVTTEHVLKETVRLSQTHSAMFGSNFNVRFFCHRWTTRAVERYTGPWNKRLKNTVLVMNNVADPITPWR